MTVDSGTVTIALGFATLLATRFFDIIDRRQKAAELREQTIADAAALRDHTTSEVASIKAVVAEGTVASKEAAAAANGFNKKIEDLAASNKGILETIGKK